MPYVDESTLAELRAVSRIYSRQIDPIAGALEHVEKHIQATKRTLNELMYSMQSTEISNKEQKDELIQRLKESVDQSVHAHRDLQTAYFDGKI